MRYILSCVCLLAATLGVGLCGIQHANAAEYRVEFARNGNGSQTVSLIPGEIANWHPWHTINDPQGVNLFNNAGAQIKAVWIKVSDPATDHFAVAFDTGHDLFPTVWKKSDNSEVLFLDGNNFMSLDTVWNRVNDTSGAMGATGNIFTGRLFTENPQVPPNWVQVSPPPHMHPTAAMSPWTDIARTLPPKFRPITVYAVNENESVIVVLSRDVPFAYNIASKELRPVLIPVPYKNGVNRLTLKNNVLELWKNGELVGRSDLAKRGSLGPPLESRR